MAQYADYSGGRPTAAALKTAGFSGVIRYVGLGASGKLLTASEYRDLAAGGIDVLLVAELGTGDSWGTSTDDDYNRGRANATAGLNHAHNCGVPDSDLFIFGASDAHAAAQWQINDTVNYIRGFRDVLGVGRTGHYGFSETNIAVRNAGVASGYWRCGSQPSAADKAWVNFWQRNAAPTTRVVAGVVCDINDLYNPISDQGENMDLTAKNLADIGQAVLDAKVTWWDNKQVRFNDAVAENWMASRGLGGKAPFDGMAAGTPAVVLAALAGLDRLDEIEAKVTTLATSGVDLDALAAKVAELVAPALAAAVGPAVAEELKNRLES